jgi:hypothetical protein
MKDFYHKTERKRIKSENNPDPNIWSEKPISNKGGKKKDERESVRGEDSVRHISQFSPPLNTQSLSLKPRNPTSLESNISEGEPLDLNQVELNLDTEQEQES